MTTLVSAVTAAVLAALQAAPAIAPQVARVRLRPLAANTTTAAVVRPLQAEVAERDMQGPMLWACRVAVECYAKTSTQTAPDVAVDALLESAYSRLMADPTLGGAVLRVDPEGITYDFDVDGEQTACATLVFSITHLSTTTAL